MIWNLIQSHQAIAGIVAMYIAATAIGALPTPRDNSSLFYHWCFRFLTGLGAGAARILAIYKPAWLVAITGQTLHPTIPSNPPIIASASDTTTVGGH
jgi:hypothetical protein